MVQKAPLDIPTTASSSSAAAAAATTGTAECKPPSIPDDSFMYMEDYDIDSSCSTPYVSAPSSPGRGNGLPNVSGFYYSAPASPMHFMISASSMKKAETNVSPIPTAGSFEFDFSTSKTSSNGSTSAGSMSSADELFLNGQIRPMKLSTHLQRPQVLAPLLDLEEIDEEETDDIPRGRDFKMRDRSLRRRTRSMSPLRTTAPFEWHEGFEVDMGDVNPVELKNGVKEECAEANASSETTPCESGASSRSSSVGRSSSRWVFLKEFLHRSKSEGRNNGNKFWGSLTFSPVKDRKIKMEKFRPSRITSFKSGGKSTASKTTATASAEAAASSANDLSASDSSTNKQGTAAGPKEVKKKPVNGVGKRRIPPSPHELHYTINRAQAEEMRKKTFLPYRQGLLGCLGFSSKSYGAMNGFARALNPVSSR